MDSERRPILAKHYGQVETGGGGVKFLYAVSGDDVEFELDRHLLVP